ncbi:G2/mitotic-specific cyclin [Pleurotus pulmonarius]|nr:G2/mitotic-specific cyclin [Pleurotus pulmonarius]KAF4582457.1 G2/mitotic-specific cyclin [Pleurotus pulmonarius]
MQRRTTTTRVTRTSSRLANENANAATNAVVTRSKAQTTSKPSASTSTVSGKSRATAPTAASKARVVKKENAPQPAVKRKREAVAEVPKKVEGGKGKGKAIADATTKPTKVPTRQPLSTVGGSAIPVRRVTRSSVKVAQQVIAEEPKPSTSVVNRPRSPVFTRPQPPSKLPPVVEVDDVDDDPEIQRAHKKLHTSPPEMLDNSTIEVEDVANLLSAPSQPQLWDDLDEEDHDDPAMVSEYVNDIFGYLKEVELTTMPHPNYMDMQPELDHVKRGILVDWIIQVHKHFKLLPETLFLCVNLMDRFLSARPVSSPKFQLVGLAAFYIACKFEEMMSPTVEEMVYLSGGQYTTDELFRAERFMLKTLNWNLSYPSPMNFLRRISKADDLNIETRTVGKYLMEIACVDWELMATPPSLLAAAAMWLGRLVLGREEWTHNLIHYSSYSEEEVVPIANMMIDYVLSEPPHVNLYAKYAAKRYMKVSVYVRQWVLNHWSEGDKVILTDDLAMLKIEARELRLKAEEEAEIPA